MSNLMGLIFLFLSAQFAGAAHLQTVPAKYLDADLARRSAPPPRFSKHQIKSGDFVQQKAQEWEACRRSGAAHAGVLSPDAQGTQDSVEAFVESEAIEKNLHAMAERELNSGKVLVQPWSGDYWAYSKGILGARNFDPDFRGLQDWWSRFQFVKSNSAQSILESQDAEKAGLLSPSEKYDLLIGDRDGFFTQSMWAQGQIYYKRDGKVEEWMGICHGWAPAAMMEPRPANTIELKPFERELPVTLKPSEIKGLVSYSWATNQFKSAFLGQRCNKKNPERDENGRLIDPECFDLNPATWHLVMVNRIGVGKKSFIMDATYDYEVWNQPVTVYAYEYFHPRTKMVTPILKNAVLKRSEFTEDPFKKYRSQAAVDIVGIVMTVGYVMETSTTPQEHDYERMDVVRWVQYAYDLELDGEGNVIGGEWYDPVHPDFVWLPLKDAQAVSSLDVRIDKNAWNGEGRFPEEWARAAKISAPYGRILNTISSAILRKSAVQ